MAQKFVEWSNNRWKAMNFAALQQSSVSFFEVEKQENVLSRWRRAITRASKVGKGSSKDNKATLLREKHWLEAIDPLHRYGENLKDYFKIWSDSQISEPFFYWLDIGDGKQLDLKDCPRTELQRQCIQYLAPKEREAYEVIIENGKLVYKQNGEFVHTIEGIKWIFVLGTSRNLFVWKKERGFFHHSSFLAGAATVAAGRIVVANGVLQAIWAYSGHYCPNEENLMESIRFLEEQQVDLGNVKTCPVDDDFPPIRVPKADITMDPPHETNNNASAETVNQNA